MLNSEQKEPAIILGNKEYIDTWYLGVFLDKTEEKMVLEWQEFVLLGEILACKDNVSQNNVLSGLRSPQ